MNKDRVKQELARRLQVRNTLTGYAIGVLGLIPAYHHQILCQALEDLIVNDLYDDLVINMPPGAAKTTYASQAFIGWVLGKFSHFQVIMATHSSKLVERVGKMIRDDVAGDEYKSAFGFGLSSDATAVARWETEEGGRFYGVGAGAKILGFRADLAVLDDVVGGAETAESMDQLQKLHEWYETDLITRLKPKGKVVCICQRLARNDMAGYIIDRHEENPTRRLKVIKFKMECENEEDDPLGRKLGERMWPEWFSEENVADYKRDDYKWRTLYQQEPPSDTGSWVEKEEIVFADRVPEGNITRYILSDLAVSVNTGDYSVHLVAAVTPQMDIYLEYAWRDRVDTDKVANKHIALCAAYEPTESLIDDDNMAKVYEHLLVTKCREAGIKVPIKMLPMRGQDKEIRAAPLRGMFKRKKVYLIRGEWNAWIVKEILAFPNAMGSGVDDGVDAFSLIGRRLGKLSIPAVAAPAAKPVDPRGTFYMATLNDLWESNKRTGAGRRW